MKFLIILLWLSYSAYSASSAVQTDLCTFNGYQIQSVNFEGLETTKPFVVQREIRQGDAFDCDTWTREKNELESLGIFAEVGLRVERIAVQAETLGRVSASGVAGLGQVDGAESVILYYEFKELLPWLILPAMKQSDQAGWMLGPGLAAVNFLGRDIFVQAFYRTDVTPKFNTTEEFLINFQSNYLGDLPLWYNFTWVKVDAFNELKVLEEESHDINFRMFYPIWNDLEVVNWHGAYIVNRDTTGRFTRETGTSKSPWLGLGLRWDGVDNLTDPKDGWFAEGLYRQFGERLGGSVESDFAEWLLDEQFYISHGDHTLALNSLTRWRVGRVPFYESFEPGGANSFRAWMPGPENSGESEFLANAEYRWTMIPKTIYNFPILNVPSYWAIQPVVGFDVVNVWSEDWKKDRRAYGYYGGFHLLVPALNRIRFELANEVGQNNWVLQIGLYEKTVTQRWRLR